MQKSRTVSDKREAKVPIQNSVTANLHRIVVVGDGTARLEIVSKLPRTAGKTGIAMILIDREPAYVWKPMLHTIAAGKSDVSQQETHYIAHARNCNFTFEPGPHQQAAHLIRHLPDALQLWGLRLDRVARRLWRLWLTQKFWLV